MSRPGDVEALGTAHVDDNGMAANHEWLVETYNHFSNRFGGATRHELPFTHTGLRYMDTKMGRRIDQDEFCQKLKPHPLTRERAAQEDSPLLPMELTAYRGLLGGLLWLC